MRKWIFVVLVLAFACVNPAQAAKAKEEVQAPAVDKAKQEKDILIANVNNLHNQELRVTVLQQVINEEVAKLRNLEAVFADQYKLDVEKFRKGLYRYDDKLGKIVEQPVAPEKK